ncbi:hypothetical protein B7463_g1924, partial [Scytalidium lignicola]
MTTQQVPEWEAPPLSNETKKTGLFRKAKLFSTKPTSEGGTIKDTWLSARNFDVTFERVLPAQKRYFGRSRKTFLLIILGVILLLILILGLGLGLGLKKT